MTAVTAPEVRFWAKVAIGDGCWEWTARREPKGYGRFHDGARRVMAHRFAYELLVGSIPDGLELDHLCLNTSCVNPAHLEAVTGEENRRRQHSRLTECKRGHQFDAANTIHRADGRRRCRACTEVRQASYRKVAA